MKNKDTDNKNAIEKSIKRLVNEYFKNTQKHNKKGFLHKNLIERVEKQLIKQVLKKTKKNQSKTAQILGISRTTLRCKMSYFNLHKNIDKID